MAEIRLNIDGKEVRGRQGDTILAIAKNNNIEIPTLCFDERMNVYGAWGCASSKWKGAMVCCALVPQKRQTG